MFDPNSITPSEELMKERFSKRSMTFFEDYKFFAQWGAAQAAEALRHQWPEPITDRLPTEADGNSSGLVQYLYCGQWNLAEWHYVAAQRYDWLHTPSWCPKPEPTPKQRARALLDALSIHSEPLTAEQVELLRQVVESTSEATP